MSVEQNPLIKWLTIAGISMFSVKVLLPLLHIAIPGPLWMTSSLLCDEALNFSVEKELDQSQIPLTRSDRNNQVSGLAWSSDGRYLLVVSFGNRRLNVYNTENWQLVASLLRDQYLPDGQVTFQFVPNMPVMLTPLIHMAPPNTISMQEWNAETNKVVASFDSGFKDPDSDRGNGTSVPFATSMSRDGSLIAVSVAAEHGDVLIFRTKTSNLSQKIHCENWIIPDAVAFSPDGETLVAGDCHLNKVSFFDTKTGNLKYETNVGRPWTYNFISYSPDGKKIAVASEDAVTSSLTVLAAADGNLIRRFPSRRALVTNLQWVDDSIILASYDDHNPEGSMTVLWDLDKGKAIEKFGQYDMAFSVMDDRGDRMAIASGSIVQVFNVTK